MSERTYAAYGPATEAHLRSDWDDVTRQAMFEIKDDVLPHVYVSGARWTPTHGWVPPYLDLELDKLTPYSEHDEEL